MINRRLLEIIITEILRTFMLTLFYFLFISITYYITYNERNLSAINRVLELNDTKHIINIIEDYKKNIFNYITTIFNIIKPDVNLEIDTSYWVYLIAIVSGIFLTITLLICCAICRLYIKKFRLSTIRPTPNIPPRWLRD